MVKDQLVETVYFCQWWLFLHLAPIHWEHCGFVLILFPSLIFFFLPPQVKSNLHFNSFCKKVELVRYGNEKWAYPEENNDEMKVVCCVPMCQPPKWKLSYFSSFNSKASSFSFLRKWRMSDKWEKTRSRVVDAWKIKRMKCNFVLKSGASEPKNTNFTRLYLHGFYLCHVTHKKQGQKVVSSSHFQPFSLL